MTESKQQFGNPIAPEFIRGKDGHLTVNPDERIGFTRCFTCNNMCGLRYRVDAKTGRLLKLAGNPYCEVTSGGHPAPLSMPVREVFEKMSGDSGNRFRATICGKGACGVDAAYDPRRVLTVLKRAGKRGEDKWKTIPYEQALEEIVEGGNLFGEGHVDGLRAVRDTKTPVKPGYPEFGPKSNQLLVGFNEEDWVRGALLRRFVVRSYGSVNFMTKHSYCGVANEVGCSLALMPRVNEHMGGLDWDYFEYAMFIGNSPGGSGHSLNKLGRMLADARVRRNVKYVCVDPILRSAVANDTRAKWQPIKPGSDTAFMYGIMQTMLNKGWECKEALGIPNRKRAEALGEPNWCNATHLVDLATGRMADAKDFGLGKAGEHVLVAGGKLANAETAETGDLYAEGEFARADGTKAKLATSLTVLKKQVNRYSMAQLTEICGAEAKDIEEIAYELTHHSRRAAAVMFIGNYGEDAVISSWCVTLINNLIGAQGHKGGATFTRGAFYGYMGAEGLDYNLNTFPGCFEKSAKMNICRDQPYETSTEYKNHVAKGENPYPAKHLYHNMTTFYTAQNAAEQLYAAINGDPYPAKILLTWRNNPVFSASTMTEAFEKELRDPKKLPLFVSIDAFINETNRNADYIIPDLTMYEEYAADRTWGNLDKSVTAGVPVLEPRTVKNAKGRHVCMEEFIIDCAVKMGLPGFGKGAIPCRDGGRADLCCFDDWHARMLSNIAQQCRHLPKVTDEDRAFLGLERAMKRVRPYLTAKQAERVEALLSRGGYYEADEHRYTGEFLTNSQHYFLQIYNPAMHETRDCFTGEQRMGVPELHEQRFFNGDVWSKHWDMKKYPFRFSTYKPTLRSNWSGTFDHCVGISPSNFVHMNVETAAKYGLKDLDRVRVSSPNGVPVEGILKADRGCAKDTVMIAHTFGHWAYGVEDREIDGKKYPGLKRRGGGTPVNRLFPTDPTMPGRWHALYDHYAGTFCRAGVPVRVDKIG
jgi:tetrathionate reductase subunit A